MHEEKSDREVSMIGRRGLLLPNVPGRLACVKKGHATQWAIFERTNRIWPWPVLQRLAQHPAVTCLPGLTALAMHTCTSASCRNGAVSTSGGNMLLTSCLSCRLTATMPICQSEDGFKGPDRPETRCHVWSLWRCRPQGSKKGAYPNACRLQGRARHKFQYQAHRQRPQPLSLGRLPSASTSY